MFMNKGLYYFLQVLLSAILLAFGLLIEIKNASATEGAAAILLAVPGAVILLALIIEFFHIKTRKVWHYIYIYLAVTLVAEVVTIVIFRFFSFSFRTVLLLLVVIIVTTAICQLFHQIYHIANKKPRII